MKKFIVVLWAVFMVLQLTDSSGDMLVGAVSESNDSNFGGGMTEKRVSNNNGVQEEYEASTSYGRKPDGTCVKKVVESTNGKKETKEFPVDCEQLKAEVQKNDENSQAAIEVEARRLRSNHDKMMAAHWKAMKNIQEEQEKEFKEYEKLIARLESDLAGKMEARPENPLPLPLSKPLEKFGAFGLPHNLNVPVPMSLTPTTSALLEQASTERPESMVIQPDKSSGSNIMLGSLQGSSSGTFGGGKSSSHFSNNNGIVDSYKAFTTYEQKPDGSCVKKVRETRNGREEVREYPMDCEQAKAELRQNSERTHQTIEAHTRNMNEHHNRMMEEHRRATQRMHDEIAASFRHHFKF